MLTQEENEQLCRVGPGTLMGELMRQYWIPGLLSSELPKGDGATLRVRLLGENLVAFRDSNGKIGMLGAHCPHRGAPLYYGRNEEGGLRCIYHGWKFDVDGKCMDMPNEPPESNFRDKIQHIAYPCRERGGVIWTYMGRVDPVPSLPDLEWNMVLEDQRYLAKRVQNCNFAQALEGDIDQSHNSFLHASNTQLKQGVGDGKGVDLWRKLDTHPRFQATDTEYGVLIGASREVGKDSVYCRITQFLFPFHTMTGPYGENPTRQSRAWIPVDDETTILFSANFHPLRPLTEMEISRMRNGAGAGFVGDEHFLPPSTEPGGAWRPKGRAENDYFFDRSLQQTKFFSGIPEFWAQDAAVQEGMGPIYDRTKEHLGTTDAAIIRVRHRLIDSAKVSLTEGIPAPGSQEPSIYRVRGAAAVFPKHTDWVEGTKELRKIIPGINQSAPGR